MITIKSIRGRKIYSTEINTGSKAKFTLMQEDYITLKFTAEAPVRFSFGDYVDIDSKRYEVTDLVPCKPNKTTGGFDYELRLDAYYWKWKNKIFKYFNQSSTNKETAWNITATPDVVMGIFIRNLIAYDYNYPATGIEFTFDLSTLERANEAKLVTFDGTNMINALNTIAEAWECEWWVTDNIIHLGKCEFGDTYVPLHTITYNDALANVEDMSQSGNRSTYATRIYAYGSERNIPSNYRQDTNTDVVTAVVKKRLMLPADKPYIDAYRYNSTYTKRIYIGESGYDTAPNVMPETEAIEDSITLDEVYPRFKDEKISDVISEPITDTIVNEDGSETKETWTRYRIKLTDLTNFKSQYILPGQTLRISFESGLLNGMDFDVTFNPEAKDESNVDSQWFEIVRNEDYGRKLPDNTLMPSFKDKVVLYNWDISAIDDLGYITDAEEELYQKASEQVKKLMTDPNNYNCRMMSDVMMGYDIATGQVNKNNALHLEIGQRVMLINDAYFEDGQRKSRIIGYEYDLDCPFDSPTYVVGESASVGRLTQIESKIQNLTIKGIAGTQGTGGSNIYIIGSNDITKASDRNVYSAMRTDRSFARKDKNDTIAEIWSFYKHLQSNGFNSGVLGNGFFLGFNQYDNNGNGTNAHLEVDTLKVRKKTMFDTLEIKHIAHVGGELILSPAGATISKVEEASIAYKCYFRNEDGTDATANQFAVDDLVMCKTFNLADGQRYYWRQIKQVGTDANGLAYFTIPKASGYYDASVTNDAPAVGDSIVVVGNASDVSRQNAIVISSYATGAPSISLYQGINAFELPESKMPIRISPSGNKFTGEFYIQILADDGSQQVMALAEFLENRISFGVNSVVYDKEYAKDTNPHVTVTDYHEIDIIDDAATEWKKGDVVDVEVGVRARNTGRIDIEIFGEEATGYVLLPLGNNIFHLDDPSGEDFDTTLSLSFTMTEDWGDNFNGYGYAYFGIHTDSEIEINPVSIKKRSLQGELKRTGIDIEDGRITLDAQTTTIKDGDKELAIFTTDTNGNAKLSTELIDADEIEANRLSTKGNTNPSGIKTDYIHIEQSQMQVYDANGLPKVKVHSGTLISDSSSGVATAYSSRTDILSKSASKLLLPATSTFYANNSNKLYKFSALTGYVNLVLTSVTNNTQFVGFPALNIDVHLYYSPTSTSDINSMLNVAKLASFVETWDKGTTGTKRIEYNIPIQPRTLSVGYYRVVVKFSIDAPHDDSTASIEGNSSGITSVIISQVQEIASNGYHFNYGDVNVPMYQKASANGFEVMFRNFGFRVTTQGISITKNAGSSWTNL